MEARRAAFSPSCHAVFPSPLPRGGLGRVPAALVALAVTLALPQGAFARTADADQDGLGDRYERRHTHTNPHKADSDGDGLRDRFEHRRSRTSPRRKDTDKDGLSDGYEVKRSKSSPRRRDTDKDGLSDGYEVKRSRTSPNKPDEDGDGLSDGVEVLFGLDPLHGPGDGPGAGSPAPGPGTPPVDVPPPDTPPPGTPPPGIPPPLPDLIAPATTITAGPSGTVTTASATFSFRSSEPGSTFQCRIDTGAWFACSTPKTYTGLVDGSHKFYVRARDAAGNQDPTPAERSWTVDVPAPPPPPPPPPPTGSADVFVSTAGSDARACTAAAPCRTLARGYAVAMAGETVSVAAGTYPAQAVPAGTKRVTFRGGSGVKVRELDNSASNVTFDGINVDANMATTAAFENHGAPGADNVTFKNAAIGNVIDEKGALVSGSNFTFDNVLFHDVEIHTRGVHLECLYAIVVPGMTIRNSEFENCGVFDVFFTWGFWWSPLPSAYGGVTLEGNHFGRSFNLGAPGYYTVMVAYTGAAPVFPECGNSTEPKGYLTNWRVTGNTFELPTAYLYDCPARHQGFVWSGNTGG